MANVEYIRDHDALYNRLVTLRRFVALLLHLIHTERNLADNPVRADSAFFDMHFKILDIHRIDVPDRF